MLTGHRGRSGDPRDGRGHRDATRSSPTPYREFIADAARRVASAPIERAIDRGELPTDVDVELRGRPARRAALLPGVRQPRAGRRPTYVTALVDTALHAVTEAAAAG